MTNIALDTYCPFNRLLFKRPQSKANTDGLSTVCCPSRLHACHAGNSTVHSEAGFR